jgi:lipoic acid synthetase
MILGGACTRNCAFCAVGKASRPSLSLDLDEPYRLQEAVRQLGLNYVVITSVTRDDLSDGGADIFAQCVELMRAIDSRIKVEVLIPDFKGRAGSIKRLLASRPDVVAHNLETVRRLYRDLRPMANYQVSLDVLKKIKEIDAAATTKSSLMLGLGETEEEVSEALADLRLSECDILTLGQYLAPSLTHYPIKEFVHPEQFKEYKKQALGLGFKGVLSGPLVRSSYKAEEVYKDVLCL